MTHRVFLFLEFFEEEEKDSKQGVARQEEPGKEEKRAGRAQDPRPDSAIDSDRRYLRSSRSFVSRFTARLTAILAASTVRIPKRCAISARLH